MKTLFAVFLATSTLLLSACSTLEDAYNDGIDGGQAASQGYTAIGQEPGWTLNISNSRVEYKGDYGQTTITAPNAVMRTDGNTQIYANGRLRVQKTANGCSDSMSGQRYSDNVVVIADGKRLTGCGGAMLPPTDLNDTAWVIEKIDGKPAILGTDANLHFSEGRLSGTAGCNRLMGGFTQQDNSLAFTQIATTRRGCAQPLMEQERAVLSALGQVTGWTYLSTGELELHGAQGALITLRRIF